MYKHTSRVCECLDALGVLTVVQVVEATSGAPTSATVYFAGDDADGDLLDYTVTSLPSHGLLELVNIVDLSEANVPITNVPFDCTVFARYRLAWWPEENSNEPVVIAYKSWDGVDYSDEASIEITIQAINGLPSVAPMNYTTFEDAELHNITLLATDVDSDFVSIFITKLPAHGTLYKVAHATDESKEIIAQTYSAWEVVHPIEQFISNVRAVSTFWPANDNAGNGCPPLVFVCVCVGARVGGWVQSLLLVVSHRISKCCYWRRRYASWHPFQLLGPQDSPSYYMDSPFAWAPSSMTSSTDSLQTGGDDVISYSFNTWASYLSHGFTEFIEVM